MTCRHQPFSVRLKFTAPPSVAGQEAAYVCGKNKGCMRVRSNGLLACIGCLSLSLDDPRAMRTNRHRIDEAGIGCLVEQMAQRHAQEHGLSGLKEEFTAVEYDGRLCTRVETTWLEPRDGIYAHRCVVLFDRDSRLPLRFEAYGDPTDEEPDGPLLELYSYHAMRFNLGVDDQAFGY
jgi:hypothetical protein